MEQLFVDISVLNGGSFVLLGIVAYLHAGSPNDIPVVRHIAWLGAFGLAHGATVILGGLSIAGPAEMPWTSAALLLGSLVPLVGLMRRVVRDDMNLLLTIPKVFTSAAVYPSFALALGLVVMWSGDGPNALRALARYVILFPGVAAAGWALSRRFSDLAGEPFDRALSLCLSGGLIGYALVAGLITEPVTGFPSWLPTDLSFVAATGIPIHVMRAGFAALAAGSLAGLVRRTARTTMRREGEASEQLRRLTAELEDRVEQRTAELLTTRSDLQITRDALNSSMSAVAIAGLDGRIEYLNLACARMWELNSPDDAIGHPVSDFWVNPEANEALVSTLSTKNHWDGNLTALTATGRHIEVQVYSFLVRSSEDEPIAFMASFIDITDRQQAELRVADNERRLRQILDSVRGFVGLFSVEGTIIFANQVPLATSGLTLEDVLGRLFWETPWWDGDPAGQAQIRAALLRAAEGHEVRVETSILTKDKALIAVDTTFSPLRNHADEITGVVGFGLDISERKAATEKLLSSERQLNQAQAMAQIGSWELDIVEGKLMWSDEVHRIFEVSRDEFGPSYDTFLDLVHPDDREALDRAYKDSIRDRSPYMIAHRLLMPDGRIKWVQEHGTTEYSPAGQQLRSLGTVQDITNRKLAENLLTNSLREKETLLHEVHHRVKNNLQVISSFLHFHAKKVENIEQKEVFEDCRTRLQSMVLVHEKLYQSKDLSAIDFADYIRALVEHLRQSFAAGARTITVEVEATDLQLSIEIALPCGMILCELLSNVFKYAFPDGRPGRTTVRVTSAGDRISLSVKDNGIGLEPGFDPDTADTFGWQLIRNLTQQVDGTYSTVIDSGTNVIITFPEPTLNRIEEKAS